MDNTTTNTTNTTTTQEDENEQGGLSFSEWIIEVVLKTVTQITNAVKQNSDSDWTVYKITLLACHCLLKRLHNKQIKESGKSLFALGFKGYCDGFKEKGLNEITTTSLFVFA